MGTPAGDRAARTGINGGYERLRVANIQHAMIDQLDNPPPGFEVGVMDAHRKVLPTHLALV